MNAGADSAGPDKRPQAPAEAGIFKHPIGPSFVVNPLAEAVREID